MGHKDFYKQLIHHYVTNQATEEESEAFFALLESENMDEELHYYLQQEALQGR
jgi:hypothetical protein